MPVTLKVERHPLKDFQPSKWCEWCVTIETDDPQGWDGPLEWSIDLPSDTDILDPEIASKIKGAPKYTVDPEPGQGRVTQPGQMSLRICFVAACKEREGATEISLDNRTWYPPSATPLNTPWHGVPFEGGPNGVGKIVGPAAIAMTAHAAHDEIATIAGFEAQKLAVLLGRRVSFPTEAEPLTSPPHHSLRRGRIYVSGVNLMPQEGESNGADS